MLIPCTIDEETKILGLRWRPDNNQLYYRVSKIDKQQRPK